MLFYIRKIKQRFYKITDHLGKKLEMNTEAVNLDHADCRNCKETGKLMLCEWDQTICTFYAPYCYHIGFTKCFKQTNIK